MKKKISALLLSLALCAGLLAGCGAGETEEAPSDTDVQQVDSLKIAFSPYADADLISESTEPLEELLKAKLLEKGYDVGEIDMTVGTSYTAVGEALSAGQRGPGLHLRRQLCALLRRLRCAADRPALCHQQGL